MLDEAVLSMGKGKNPPSRAVRRTIVGRVCERHIQGDVPDAKLEPPATIRRKETGPQKAAIWLKEQFGIIK